MKLSRVVAARLSVVAVLFLPSPAGAQSAPKLSKSQRALLEATVVAVDQAAATGTAAAADWQSHVLRASDGSHYVAWSAVARDVAPPKDAAVLYVRLATRPSAGTSTAVGTRSAVAEWLKGLRGDPLPMRAGRSMTVPQGEMPVGGAAALGGRPGSASAGATEASNALRLQDLVRERAVRERTEREKQRRSALEVAGRAPAPAMHPFEDFDLEARFAPAEAGLIIARASRRARVTTTCTWRGRKPAPETGRRSCTSSPSASSCPAPRPPTSG